AAPGELSDGGGSVHLRHPQVHQDHVRPQQAGQPDGLGPVGGLADDLEAGLVAEHPGQAVTDDRVVVGDQQPDDRGAVVGGGHARPPAAAAGSAGGSGGGGGGGGG